MAAFNFWIVLSLTARLYLINFSVNDDLEMAEWGYFSLQELCDLKVEFLEVDRDLHFEPQKAMGIERIKQAERW